ncbi:hypothetical protein BKP35_12860 [Anaerobacillus arseniciselenatis]|uniref:Cytosolic protein n=1 Tax=Anaerobacillus arseniciselenatis TaxID=85682 RepID=A0A1S2LEM2_9BACI|nr:hypothetical protein [Anaerobacillus arseniciselenatis]OIJ10969.1 hypothetical protein BKP35_12860 [Anaerobacillus arseniciselenatis]
MGFKDTLNKFISNHTETRENHSDGGLKTHYYKAMKDKTFNELLTIFHQSENYDVKSSSVDRGEIIVDGKGRKKLFIVATVIMVSPNRTAIDFSVTTETVLPTDFGYSSKVIKELYQKIGKNLEYVGSGLGDQLS